MSTEPLRAAERPWTRYLSEADREVYAAAGYGVRGTPGSRPALLVVDVTHDFVGDRRAPILESIREFPSSCGEAGWDAMDQIARLLEAARETDTPRFFTKALDNPTPVTRGSWTRKSSRSFDHSELRRRIGNVIPSVIAPRDDEIVIQKTKPSAFFGTPLASYLTELGIDTVIVTGGATSGCIRATVVDAFSLNMRVLVPEEAVFDRGEMTHAANLFDIDAKYGDVVSTQSVIDYLHALRPERETDAVLAGLTAG